MFKKIFLGAIVIMAIFTLLSADWYLQHSGVRTLYSITFPPGDVINGFACGTNSFGLRTTNGGATWDTMEMQAAGDYQDINFPVDNMVGFAACDFGYVAKTTDAGNLWQVHNANTSEQIYAVHFPTDYVLGYAVGARGVARSSYDGGMWWNTMTTPLPYHLYDVYFMNQEFGLAVGDHGTILISYGIDWISTNSTVTDPLYSVYILADGSAAWVVGANSTCLKSTDLGTTWERVTLPLSGPTRLNCIVFPNASTGYICGDGGIILKTTNGGNSWDTTRVPGGENLYEIVFPAGDSIGWVCGSNEAIYSTLPVGIKEVKPISSDKAKTFSANPNPFRTKTVIQVPSSATSNPLSVIHIYDCSGKLIKTLITRLSTHSTLVWDGRDEKNQKVTPGVYLLELKNNKGTALRTKLTIIN